MVTLPPPQPGNDEGYPHAVATALALGNGLVNRREAPHRRRGAELVNRFRHSDSGMRTRPAATSERGACRPKAENSWPAGAFTPTFPSVTTRARDLMSSVAKST